MWSAKKSTAQYLDFAKTNWVMKWFLTNVEGLS